MNINPKSISDGFLYNRLYSFEEGAKEKSVSNRIPSPIQEIEPFDPAEYWEAINDRDKRIEALYNQNEALSLDKAEHMKKNLTLIQETESLKNKIYEMEQEYAESCRKYERNIANLERKLLEINDKLEKSTKLIETFEENSKILENLVHNCKNEGEISEETVDFQANLEKNFEQMQMIETASATIYKETIETLKKGYEEKLEDVKKNYEEKLKIKEKSEENKEDLEQKLEKMGEICTQMSLFEEKAKSLGYTGIDEALEQNKLLWEEIKSLRKTQETYKNENEQLHHELDSFVEKIEKKENDFKEVLLEKENLLQAETQKKIEEKELEFKGKKHEFESRIKVLALEIEKNKQNLDEIQVKYEENLQKMNKDSEAMDKMKQALEINERNNREYLNEIANIKSSKIKHAKILMGIVQAIKNVKKDLEEMKKSPRKYNKSLENQVFTELKNFFSDFQTKFLTNKKEYQNQKDSLNVSRNLTTVESESGLDLRNAISLNYEKKSPNFNDKNKRIVSARPIFVDVQDFSEFVQLKESVQKLTHQKSEKNEEKISKELKDLKENFSSLQGEHMKIAEIVDESLKGGSNKVKNEFILFNYFEKLFDRLSLSLQKENEIKSMISVLDEKFDRNFKEPGLRTFELETMKTKNLRLIQELQEKSEALINVENERNDYKKTCKDLQIQLDFKKVQNKYSQETQETQNNTNKTANYDVSEIYQKYLKTKPMNMIRQTEIPVKHSNGTPRTPNGKDVNKTIAKIIQDNQRTKNGKLNVSKDSSKDGIHYI